MRIFTVGHSTHPVDHFVAMLQAHGVEEVVDVRTIARSRHNPQFAEDQLRVTLGQHALGYVRIPALGGLRRPRPDSPNRAWRNVSFRGYADHMLTDTFASGLADLLERAKRSSLAIMCAEAVPWRCHRSLVADALLVRGVEVLHIMSEKAATPHALTRFAHVDGHRVTYPPGPADGTGLPSGRV